MKTYHFGVVLINLVVRLSYCSELDDKVTLCSKESVVFCQCKYTKNYIASVIVDCLGKNLSAISTDVKIPKNTELLDLSGNNIEIIPDRQLESDALSTLLLKMNRINSIAIDAFLDTPNMQHLDLSYNRLDVLEHRIFSRVHNLKTLNLAHNKFTRLGDRMFSYLQNLISLNLNGNDLGYFLSNIDDVFETGPIINAKLEDLSLASINITEFPVRLLVGAYNLRNITLAFNNITSIPRLPYTIEYIDISATEISTLGPENFTDHPAIKYFIANHLENLETVPNNTFEGMKNLRQISLENCKRLENFSPYAFGENVSAHVADLPLARVSFMGSSLATLDESLSPLFYRLTSLNLKANPWNCDCNFRWLRELQLDDADKEFIRCHEPKKFAFEHPWSIPKEDLVCTTHSDVIRWVTINAIILLCVLSSVLAAWLIFLWPPRKTVNRSVAPNSPYSQITIQPNQAEDISY